MKTVIKWALKHLPRPLMQRLAGWMTPVVGLLLRGKRFTCPLCGHSFRRLLPYGYVTTRENALCPSCLSLERHRLLWLWMERESNLLKEYPRLLHIAPEVCLMKRLKKHYRHQRNSYLTADLESPLADLHFDIQHTPLADDSFGLVICNHLLEHVEDDRLALRELCRILKPGGWGILLAPIDYNRATTYEDNSITDPEERTRLFGQYDHRRIYGRDYPERLREAGFEAEEIDYAARLTPEERRRYALPDSDRIYLVRKPLN
ncbi:MAG: methyltransferase domain-containing protein [Rikenellaceae bacterium]|nr:methyltransferase domain-containing protein [Rikenellaceae bacterium]